MLRFPSFFVTRVDIATTSAATDAPVVDSVDDDMCAAYASYLEDANADEHHSSFHVPDHGQHVEFETVAEYVEFETVAEYVAGTVHRVWDICYAAYHWQDSSLFFMKNGIFRTDPEAQRYIALRIFLRKFGTNTNQAIANHLDVFTDPLAQRNIASAIHAGTFGTNPNVLQAISDHTSVFTDADAQRLIAEAT